MIEAFYETWPLWAFLSVLGMACAAEDLINHYRRKGIDNPALW
jgi:hypothetical protein